MKSEFTPCEQKLLNAKKCAAKSRRFQAYGSIVLWVVLTAVAIYQILTNF